MQFLESIREKFSTKAHKVESEHEQYAALLRRAVAEGKLPPAEQTKFEKLAESLGFSFERIEADTDVVRTVAAGEAVAAGMPEKFRQAKAMQDEYIRHVAESERIRAEHAALMSTRDEREAELKRMSIRDFRIDERDIAEARRLRADHPALFGDSAPVDQVEWISPMTGEIHYRPHRADRPDRQRQAEADVERLHEMLNATK